MEKTVIETERLVLRPWTEDDAESLYEYAKDPRVGPSAGWQAHASVEESLETIRTVFSVEEIYAVCPKGSNKPVGCVGLHIGEKSSLSLPENEAEIGYWIGVPFWGQGLIPEAVNALINRSFATLKMEKLWCGYFEGNEKSKRVQEKCGFTYHHTKKDVFRPLINEIKTEHYTLLAKENWEKSR